MSKIFVRAMSCDRDVNQITVGVEIIQSSQKVCYRCGYDVMKE